MPRRLAIALLGLAVSSGAAAAAPARARTDVPSRVAAAPTAGACDDDRDVTVVVDFTYFGGDVQVRCAAVPVGSGFEALTKAGFRVDQVASQPGLLCRIDGEPSGFHCQTAPPSNAYWAYWHAARGGSWAYSSSGASRTPPPGSVEGWAFGAQARPGIDPPPAPPPTTTTTPPPAAGVPSNPPGGASGSSAAAPAPPVPTHADPPVATTTTGAPASTDAPRLTDDDRIAGGSRDEGAGEEVAGAPAGGARSSDGGSPVGVVVAGLALGGVALGAAVRAAARRRGDLREGST